MSNEDRFVDPVESTTVVADQQSLKRRRDALRLLAMAGIAGASLKPTYAREEAKEPEEDVSPAEDLMREHGLLNRILLIYEESISRLSGGREIDPAVLSAAAGIIRSFVEDYHEKLEEGYLFPRFQKAGKLTDLVAVLKQQHQAGRTLTDSTLRLATAAAIKDPGEKARLVQHLTAFVRMYRPHEAREDTVLFPAFKHIVSEKEYDSLGDDFEKKEHELFGEQGFETMVKKVAELEKRLGIYELAQFTPALK